MLPDALVVDLYAVVLRRVGLAGVQQMRCVCRRWCALTASVVRELCASFHNLQATLEAYDDEIVGKLQDPDQPFTVVRAVGMYFASDNWWFDPFKSECARINYGWNTNLQLHRSVYEMKKPTTLRALFTRYPRLAEQKYYVAFRDHKRNHLGWRSQAKCDGNPCGWLW